VQHDLVADGDPPPIVIGTPGSTCSTALSCTLLPSPMVIGSESARITAPGHTLVSSPRKTRPMTDAVSATNVLAGICGDEAAEA
jgi:hypothetical protein